MKTGQFSQRMFSRVALFATFIVLGAIRGWSQELGGAGTVQGTVKIRQAERWRRSASSSVIRSAG